MSWKSCDNCGDRKCSTLMAAEGLVDGYCDDWSKLPCPICGGTLSVTHGHNGKEYRHCFSCHMEIDENRLD